MTPPESLPPDQRAVLQLLLKQGKSYDDLAGILRIDRDAVRGRATAALDSLGPRDGASIDAERRGEIADYLLGQQTASQRAATRAYLEESASARGWTRVVAGELRPLAGPAGLPDVPAEGAEVDEAFDALSARKARNTEVQRSSRIGGALLLGGVGLLLALVILWATGTFDSGSGSTSSDAVSTPASSTPASTTPSTTSTTAQPAIVGQVNLRPPSGGKALGVANVLEQSGQRALAIQGQGLAPSTSKAAYAVWLQDGPGGPKRLGFAPPVAKDGRLQGVAGLPANASKFRTVLITRETTSAPKTPGTVILSGRLQLAAPGG